MAHLHASTRPQKQPEISRKSTDPPRRKPKGSTAWYNEQVPPFALWVAGNDDLVDGEKLLRRFERGREPHIKVAYCKVIPEYEHLDIIWAMDAVSQVFEEVREVLWKTVSDFQGQSPPVQRVARDSAAFQGETCFINFHKFPSLLKPHTG